MNNSIGGVKNRREGALERLIAQLKTGKKTVMVYESAMTKHSPRFIPGKFVLHKVDLTE